MALYHELPIFKTAYDLLIYIFQITKAFPKEYKYTIGEKIKSELLELILSIFKANSSLDKKLLLSRTQEHLETVKILLRVSQDIKIVPLKQYTHSSLLIDSVSKQLTGWKKSLN